MQRTAFAPNAFKAAGVATPRGVRTAVKVSASSRVDKFSKDDIIVRIINVHNAEGQWA
jgi:hypothetical protein